MITSQGFVINIGRVVSNVTLIGYQNIIKFNVSVYTDIPLANNRHRAAKAIGKMLQSPSR